MKKFTYIFAGLALIATLAACNRELSFDHKSFVSMYGGDQTVTEDVGTIKIPVSIYNNKDGATITVKCIDGSAVSGTNYQLVEPASGVINAAAADTLKTITVKIIDRAGIFDGNLNFKVGIESQTEGVETGALKTVTITIKDNDHPLVDFFGEYTMRAVCANSNDGYSYPEWTVNVSAYEGDVTRLTFSNLTYMTAVAYHSYTGDCPVYGVVSADKKTITFPFPQHSGDLSAFMGYESEAYYFGHSGAGGVYNTADVEVVFTLDEASGMWITQDSFGISHPDDVASYPNLFYYYAVNYSNFNSGYPTYFKKN